VGFSAALPPLPLGGATASHIIYDWSYAYMASVDAAATTATGPGLTGGPAGSQIFQMLVVDQYGNPIYAADAVIIEVIVADYQGPLNMSSQFLGAGEFLVTFEVIQTGVWSVGVLVGSSAAPGALAPIYDSPWLVNIIPAPLVPANTRAWGQGLSEFGAAAAARCL
jgi:hypothetical protein